MLYVVSGREIEFCDQCGYNLEYGHATLCSDNPAPPPRVLRDKLGVLVAVDGKPVDPPRPRRRWFGR